MGIMRLFCVGALFVPLMLPLFASVEGRVYSATETLVTDNYAHVIPKYDRLEEAERACEEVIDSASELGSDDNRAYSIRHDLSFSGGDWDQEPGTTRPLLPFADAVGLNNPAVSIRGSPFKLSSFSITDVNYAHRSKHTVSVNGVLDLVMTSDGPLPETGISEPNTQFQMWRGHTQVSVFFQGVYTESEENGGDRVMCLLGSAVLPTRQSDAAHPWPWVYVNSSDSTNYQPPMWLDDQILLVLHYPLRFTLTQREIKGEMRSLSLKTDLKYFDNVQILSQLTTQEYKFGSQDVHKACDPYTYVDNLLAGGIDIYKGRDFCSLFEAIQLRGPFVIMPNWRCSGTEEFCSKLGPFVTDDKEIIGTLWLLMQNVHCERKRVKGNVMAAKVSLVLRLVPSHGNLYIERRRNALGNMTLAAEGVWNSSTGKLCMVGCLGIAESNACDSQVCLYIPTTFSINQRSPLVGSISSIKAKTPSYFPLSFQLPIRFGILRSFYRYTNLRYKYSRIGLAGALLEKHESSSFGNTIKMSLLKFPRLQENEDYYSSFLLLAEDLTFHARLVLDPSPSSLLPFVSMQILSVGSIFIPYSHFRNFSYAQVGTPYRENAEYTKKQLLVNVSAQLSISVAGYDNFSSLFVEGLYNPVVGKMYLIGCRDVRASSKILFERNDVDGGLDCSTEVIISYPPVTAQWLLNPAAGISITSKRLEDDPLYFKPVQLKTLPITYRRQREAVLSEREIEGLLRVLTLSVAVACILLQVFYLKRASDYVACVSLVMLGIQALGYGLPLITGVESLLKRKRTESQIRSSYELEKSELFHAIGFAVKLLVLTAFLLTLRLLQKVWKCRARLLRQEPLRVPNDKLVLLVTSVIHIFGFVCALYLHASNTPEAPMFREFDAVESSPLPTRQRMILLEEYMGVVQDLFLFPQVVGNLVWQIESEPLRKLYYIGISVVRLLPHVYDYFKASTLNPYFPRDYGFVNPDTDFYSKLSDVLIPAMTALLALLVYVQQRWSYDRLSNALAIGPCRLLPLRPKAYHTLPSESFEAELATTRDQEEA